MSGQFNSTPKRNVTSFILLGSGTFWNPRLLPEPVCNNLFQVAEAALSVEIVLVNLLHCVLCRQKHVMDIAVNVLLPIILLKFYHNKGLAGLL